MNKSSMVLKAIGIGLLVCICQVKAQTNQTEEQNPMRRPHVSKEPLSPESFSFAIKLPPGTDCSVKMKPAGEKNKEGGESASAAGTSDSSSGSMKLERLIRKGISESKETNPDGSEVSYYFLNGWCAWDSPLRGLNVRRYIVGHPASNLAVFDFPELDWAVPNTRQVDPTPKEGDRKIHVYKDGTNVLEVDAASNFPLRFNDGYMEWTYSYKASSDPIVLPEKIKAGLDHVFNPRSRKP